jgi:hypothetical protein
MIRAKAAEYMERAEKLKNHLADADKGNRKKPSAIGANGKASGGSGKGGKYVNAYLSDYSREWYLSNIWQCSYADSASHLEREIQTTKSKTPNLKS